MSELTAFIQEFHFLRPLWLLGLLLLPIIHVVAKQINQHQSSWSNVIDSQLLNHLLEGSTTKKQRWPIYILLIALFLAFIALSGPTWKKIPQLVHKAEDALVIVLDLSLSMQATDIKPSRLVQAKHKLIDILNQRQQGQTALVVYAGIAHTVAPLTDDTETIKALAPALSPVIMPALGNRVDSGIELASQLIKDGGVGQGQILLITDGIAPKHIKRISKLLGDNTLSILAIGTANGGPIPMPNQELLKDDGQIVITKLALGPLQNLVQETGARFSLAQLSDTDINYLLDKSSFELSKSSRQVERQFDQWHEAGPLLLLIIIPLAALAFRRGWLLSLLILVLIQPPTAYAFGWNDLWKTPDQQGEQAFQDGKHAQAAELFESPNWKGSAAYKAKDFETAAKEFSRLNTSTAHYNRGNALAKAGKLDEALSAYDEALRQEPEFVDAKTNKEFVQQLKKQQDQQSKQQNSKKSSEQNQDNQSSGDQQSAENQPSTNENNNQTNKDQSGSSQENNNSENQQAQKKQNDDGTANDVNTEEKDKNTEQQAEAAQEEKKNNGKPSNQLAQANNESKLSEEQQQAMEQWLRRIPDDPSGLLKRKFDYQFRQRQKTNQFLPEKDNETLW